jgi:hypothetical protein
VYSSPTGARYACRYGKLYRSQAYGGCNGWSNACYKYNPSWGPFTLYKTCPLGLVCSVTTSYSGKATVYNGTGWATSGYGTSGGCAKIKIILPKLPGKG